MLVFRRRTYEGMAGYWQTAKGEDADLMNALPKLVFSRSLDRADWTSTRIVTGDATIELANVKRTFEGNIFVFGSANLSESLTDARLIDEYRICIIPVILGRGTPLFKITTNRIPLELLESRRFASGSLVLRYARC